MGVQGVCFKECLLMCQHQCYLHYMRASLFQNISGVIFFVYCLRYVYRIFFNLDLLPDGNFGVS